MNGDPNYTFHATTATAMSAALVAVVTWVMEQYHLVVPTEIVAAAVLVITPFVSLTLRKLGVATA